MITNKLGGTLLSEFQYQYDVPSGQITSWSQQTGTPNPSMYSLGYDHEDQLLSAAVSEGGTAVQTFTYSYDPAGNRLTEQVDATMRRFSYNALNELTTVESDAGVAAMYQWDAEQRLVSATAGNKSTLFIYDGLGRLGAIRLLVDELEVSNRQFIWCDNEICEERAPDGTVSKRFFSQGVKLETGVNTGDYFYTRDHLGSVRELTDRTGNVRARYAYDPFGQQTKLMGDLKTDFGFAGMLWISEAGLNLTLFRAYDPNLGRWLSRDPLDNAEVNEGYNLFCYVQNDPINRIDPLGLDWWYSQSTGILSWGPPAYAGGGPPQEITDCENSCSGYSGAKGKSLNNPAMQDVRNVGPIPQGFYYIDPQKSNEKFTAFMRLTPGQEIYGRSGFLIHGDNKRRNQSASEGCIILPRDVRNIINNSEDHWLIVTP